MARPRRAPDPSKYPVCVRCGEAQPRAAIWPDGGICSYCYMKAKRTHGTCAACGHIGVLPGIGQEDQPICRSCSGIALNVDCRECGAEGELYRGSRCWRCELRREASALLSPINAPAEKVALLVDAIAGMKRPNSGLTWIRQPYVRELLTALGASDAPITHDALDAAESSRAVEYLRSLLVVHGVLPARDRLLADFDQWVSRRQEEITDPSARPVLTQFVRWHQKRRMTRAAADNNGQTPRGVFLNVKQTTTVTIQFLNWIDENGLTLQQADQHVIDEWFGNGPSTRELAQAFIYWAQDKRHMPRVDLPRRERLRIDTLGVQGRLSLLRKVLTDDDCAMTARIAGGIILLFGQPVNRTVSLQFDAIRATPAGDLEIRFADDWVPVPAPFAVLLDRWIASRPNLQTAAHESSPWLFPGTMPGEHLQASGVQNLLARHGIPPRAARTAAWRELVRSVPPPLLASAFGVAPHTVDEYSQQAGSRYARYAGLRRAR